MNEDKTPANGPAEHGTGSSGEPPALTPGNRWRQVFPGEERQIGAVRRWLASLLPDCPARDDVTVVASEMTSNAVQHTASGQGGWFAVEIIWHPLAVRVTVEDGGALAGPRLIDDPESNHGRGLQVVQGMSLRTGVHGDHRGRQMWADVPWGADEPRLPQAAYEAAIRAGTAALNGRFAGVTAWFGRSTLQWWALARGELLTAPSAEELASLLGRVLDHPPPWRPAARDTACEDAKTARAAGREQRPGILAPQFPPGRALLPRDGLDGTRRGGHGGPRTLSGGCRPGVRARRTAMSGGLGLPAAASSGC
jgi:anti-sigma regulatory factor (Ser/Thr protein kinase)